MLEKTIHSTIYFVLGAGCLILGFTSIFIGDNILKLTLTLASIFLVANGLIKIWNGMVHPSTREKRIFSTAKGMLDIVVALFIVYHMPFVYHSVIRLIGLYVFMNACIFLFTYFLYIRYNIKGRLAILVKFIIYFIFSILLILHPESNDKYAQIVIGIYLIIYGISALNDFIIETIPKEKTDSFKKLIKIPLPLFITAFIPQRLINLINELIEVEPKQDKLSVKKSNQKPDLEVIIHLAESGSAAFGHMEICFQGKIYSYGNYDLHSRKFFDMVGDGVLLIADRDSYIKYNVEKLDRYLVCFGLKLTKKQQQDIKKRITYLISSNTEDWYPDAQKADMGEIPQGEYKEISSDLYRYANAKFKKIINGKNKKFFVLRTNCAIIVDYILGSISSTILNINGLITPGTYYEYLNNEFVKKNSSVITRKIYTRNDFLEDDFD